MGNIRVRFRVPYLKMEGDGAILECRFTVCDWLIEPNIPKSQTINILVVSKRLLHVLRRKQLAFSHPSALTKSKCKNWSILSSKFDSLILKTHFISLGRVSNMHFFGCQNEGLASCKIFIRRAAAVKGGTQDSSSWIKIACFLCKIRFRTHMFIIWGQTHNQKNHKKLTARWWGGEGVHAYSPFFWRLLFL